MTLLRCQVYLAGQRSTNWGHHLYHSKVDGKLSHDRHTPHRHSFVSELVFLFKTIFSKNKFKVMITFLFVTHKIFIKIKPTT